MDGRKFDDLARSLAQRTSRRRFLAKGTALATIAGGLIQASPAEAARRGKPPTTAICTPDGAGGYTRIVVQNVVLSAHLAAGAVLDNGCCSENDCLAGSGCMEGVCDVQTGACSVVPIADDTPCTSNGPIDLCRSPSTCQAGVCSEGMALLCPEIAGGCQMNLGCNPTTGLCETGPVPNGSSCLRGPGCANGTCLDGVCQDPTPRICPSDACRICGYDACQDICSCFNVGCGTDYPECQTAACDPELGCVYRNINEDGPCTREGQPGICIEGVCRFIV